MDPFLAKTSSLRKPTESILLFMREYSGMALPPLAGLDVHDAPARELELVALAGGLPHERLPVHVEDELLADVARVPYERVRVHEQRLVGGNLQGEGGPVGERGDVPRSLDGRGKQPLARGGAAQPGEDGVGAHPVVEG